MALVWPASADQRLFDKDYYFAHNPDVARSRTNPLRHFFVFGAAEGRNPHPDFDTSYYLDRYPDVRQSGVNPAAPLHPLWHREGRMPNRLLHNARSNPDLGDVSCNPLARPVTPEGPRQVEPVPAGVSAEPSLSQPAIAAETRRSEAIPEEAKLRFLAASRELAEAMAGSNSLVSVVIPCYNYGRYVWEAINSALAQTYPHVEVVIRI